MILKERKNNQWITNQWIYKTLNKISIEKKIWIKEKIIFL